MFYSTGDDEEDKVLESAAASLKNMEAEMCYESHILGSGYI